MGKFDGELRGGCWGRWGHRVVELSVRGPHGGLGQRRASVGVDMNSDVTLTERMKSMTNILAGRLRAGKTRCWSHTSEPDGARTVGVRRSTSPYLMMMYGLMWWCGVKGAASDLSPQTLTFKNSSYLG